MPEPAARSPIAPAAPMLVMAGWEASGRRAGGALTLTDGTPLAKAQIRAPCGGQAAAETGVPFGRAARDRHGTLLAGTGRGSGCCWRPRPEPGPDQLGDEPRRPPAGELVTVIDLTHGRALIRLNGPFAADVPGKVCATGTSDGTTPDGAASRASAAAVATGVIRDDAAGLRS